MPEIPFHRDVDITTTQSEIIGDNPQRYYCLIVNSSDTDCYISLGQPAESAKGILLKANGGAFEINLTNPFHGRIYAISGAATKRLNLTEISG